jgi:hypothetical protein
MERTLERGGLLNKKLKTKIQCIKFKLIIGNVSKNDQVSVCWTTAKKWTAEAVTKAKEVRILKGLSTISKGARTSKGFSTLIELLLESNNHRQKEIVEKVALPKLNLIRHRNYMKLK